MERRSETYLGDGVYGYHDGYQIWLRVNNDDWGTPTAEVALEPEVMQALIRYAIRIGVVVGIK